MASLCRSIATHGAGVSQLRPWGRCISVQVMRLVYLSTGTAAGVSQYRQCGWCISVQAMRLVYLSTGIAAGVSQYR